MQIVGFSASILSKTFCAHTARMEAEIAQFRCDSEDMAAQWAGRTLKSCAVAVLKETSVVQKARMTFAIVKAWHEGGLLLSDDGEHVPDEPGRPQEVKMVAPQLVKSGSKKRMLHSLVHAESYAIDLSWDIIARYGWNTDTWLRFDPQNISGEAASNPATAALAPHTELHGAPHMPREFFEDWIKVAAEEAKHMTKWRLRLESLGGHYGEFTGHDSLWESAVQTAHSLPARLAIVHCVHEARGLDVYTGMMERLQAGQDTISTDILKANHEEEVDHVRKGARWLTYLCQQAGVPPHEAYQELVRTHFRGQLRPPFNVPARTRAGMPQEWYLPLAQTIPDRPGQDLTKVEITEEDMG